MKVVINTCFGGFGLSDEAWVWLIENRGWMPKTYGELDEVKYDDRPLKWVHDYDLETDEKYTSSRGLMGRFYYSGDRDNPEFRSHSDIIEIVELLKEKASGRFANLTIVEVPDDTEWYISEYDGNEHVAEVHKKWG